MNELVSIITPSYNRAALIDETAQSIFGQTYSNWEWIIVDDGSTDNSWSILQAYASADERVKIFKRERGPKGACACRNIGVEMSKGGFLIFLDTDDLLEPFCLAQRVGAMSADPDLDFGIFPSLMFTSQPFDLNLWWNIDKSSDELNRQFHQDAICQGTGILIKRSSFIKVGMWNEELYLWQDIDLFFRLYIQGYRYKKFFHLAPDLHNRMNVTSMSRGDFFAKEKLDSRTLVIKNTVKLLKENNLQMKIAEAKYMTGEIVSGLARSKYYTAARGLCVWAKDEMVITGEEKKILLSLVSYYQNRFYKFPFFKNRLKKYQRSFHIQNTLGKIPYKS